MFRTYSWFISFAATCLLTALPVEAQAMRTVPVGLGLGHLVHGVGNPPLRLSNDAVALVSEGATEGTGIPDDDIVIVSGFESGELHNSVISLPGAFGSYGDLSRTMVRLDDSSFLYYDRGPIGGAPQLLTVTGAGKTNTTSVCQLKKAYAFDPNTQPIAVLDASTVMWAAVGNDGVVGTADDLIVLASGLGSPHVQVRTLRANSGLGGDLVAVSATRAIARSYGPDGIPGTLDDELLVVDVKPDGSLKTTPLALKTGVAAFPHTGGPASICKDMLVYPTAGPGRPSLYAVIRDLTHQTPRVIYAGYTTDCPPGSPVPQPVGIGRDTFVYMAAGRDGHFHTRDDEVHVVSVAATAHVQSMTLGLGLGFSDTSLPPADLGSGRIVFGTNGPDQKNGTADDGVVVVDFTHTPPAVTLATNGVEAISLTAVNPDTVTLEALDGSFLYFQYLSTPTPQAGAFYATVPCPSCFVRLNDWTLVGSVPVTPGHLADDVLTIQFPFVEVYGVGQTCHSGQKLTIGRDLPFLGSIWPAKMHGGITGLPAAVTYSWFADDVPLNLACRFYLNFNWVFQMHVVTVDVNGDALVWNQLPLAAWLPGHSFCGQWGIYDPQGYNNLCTSSGFRVHF